MEYLKKNRCCNYYMELELIWCSYENISFEEEQKRELANFMETREYLDLLEKQIGAAKKVAGDEAMIVYMDPSDEDKARRLAMHHNVTVKISEYSFDGGIRAVIPSKHILIDSSFKTKLEESRHEFKFDLGGKQ